MLVTVVVIAGMFLWPATSDCMNGGGTFGSCLQQSLAQRGLAPAPAPEETAVAEPEIVAGEEPAEPVEVPDETVVATAPMIDARVEPDGSTILAGTVEPNVDIQLFFNGVEVGQTTSDSAGDWVFIPDEPLPAGGVAITLRTGTNGEMFVEGPEALAVVVDGESQPTVVATAPDELTGIITELTGSAPEMADGDLVAEEEPMEVAAVEPDDVPEVTEPETVVPDADLIAPEPAVEEAPEADAEEVAPPADTPETAEPVQPDVEEEEPIELAAVEPEASVQEEQPVTAVPPVITVEPTIDAVEIEPDGSFIAGAGQDGMTVRLFVDDQLIGESPVEGGRWLVQTDEVLTEPNQRIRAEMVAPGDIVTAEAEINFVIDQGDSASPVADAELIAPAGEPAPAEAEAPMEVAAAPEAISEPEPEPEVAGEAASPGDADGEMSPSPETPATETDGIVPEAEAEAEPVVEESSEPEAEAESEGVTVQGPDGQVQLPEDEVAPPALPDEAPTADVPTAPEETQVAEAEQQDPAEPQDAAEPEAGQLASPEEQSVPVSPPVEEPLVEAPSDIVSAEAEPVVPADEQVVLPEDQSTPIDLSTEEPSAEQPSDIESAEAEMAAPADEQVNLPEDQSAPTAVPAEAPPADSAATEPSPAETTTSAESIVTLPEELPESTEVPAETPAVPDAEVPDAEVADDEVAEGADSVITLPTDQSPAADQSEDSSPSDVAAAAEPVAEEPEMETAEAEPPVALDDEAPSAELPQVVSPAPATRPEPATGVAEAELEAEVADDLPEAEETEDEVPTLVATPVGDPEDGRFASGKVIIRRGDNLWTIARRVYGRGIQYTVIFEANREKINNPHLIFPGQVFDLPEAAQR